MQKVQHEWFSTVNLSRIWVTPYWSAFIFSVRYFSGHTPECCPEGSGWDELRDSDCVRVQHRPYESCHSLAHWPGGAAILATQHRDHSKDEDVPGTVLLKKPQLMSVVSIRPVTTVRRCLWKQRGSTTADHAVRGSATPVPVTGCPCQNEAGVAVPSGCARPATSKEHRLMLAARVSLHSSACIFLKKVKISYPSFWNKKLYLHDLMYIMVLF